MNTYSSAIIRYALCLLFFWFGVQQLMNPSIWVSYLPEFTGYFPVPGEMLVQMNGWFEIIFSILLLLGVYTRLVVGILGVHLLGIAASAGGAVGMRDLTLSIVCFALAISSVDNWTLDHYLARRAHELKGEVGDR